MKRLIAHRSIVSSVSPRQVLVIGPLAYDDVRTPHASRSRVFGGSAAYASVAAAKYGPTMLVSVSGSDLRDDDLAVVRGAGVDVSGLEQRDGRTLRWSGTYSDAFARSAVENTDLGVVVGWQPAIPVAGREAGYVFLTNTDPAVQARALDQLHPEEVLLDTMDEWILDRRPELERIMTRVTIVSVNEHELHLITGEDDLSRGAAAVLARGPRTVVVKRGASGASMFTAGGAFTVSAYPATTVDPTGAGDALGGAFVGRLSRTRLTGDAGYRDALMAGVAAASLAVESFGVDALARASLSEVDARAAALERRSGTAVGVTLYEGR